MFRMKTNYLFVMIFALLLSACAPGSEQPGQAATIVADSLTQTASPANPTAVSTPLNFPITLTTYKSANLGIQFSYPEDWYLNEFADSKDIFGAPTQVPSILLTSFDPANPPHKSEWNEQTIGMQFRSQPRTFPNSFEEWAQVHKEAALAHQLTISSEERFSIANQPAARLTLVSGTGGIIHQVLTDLNNIAFEINIEGNFDLARPVLDSLQPVVFVTFAGVRPSSGEFPAAGVCGDAQGDPVNIVLGIAADGLPKAGRCIAIHPAQRIRLINRSDGLFDITFAGNHINLPVGGEILLDKPVGEYLALGVHHLPMAPELWVKTTSIPAFTPMPLTPASITIEATMADNGRTFVMNVGDKLRLDLDLSYGWSAFSISNPAVIAGAQDGFFALEAGTATLTTTGNPECLNFTPPCGMPSILYSITVIVQ